MIVNETVLFPKVEYRIETQDEKTEKLINTIEQSKDQQVIMIHSLDGVSLDNVIEFPSLGVLSTLTLKLLVPNSKTRAVFLCHERVKVTNYEKENDIWYVDIEDVNVKEIPKEKNTLYIDMLLRSYEKYSNLIANTSNAMLHQLSFIDNLSDLTDSLAVLLPFSIELKKKYLYEEDPIKIIRDEKLESNIKGIYPCGEGSGYAGGITSSAIDGIKVAEEIIKKYYY